MTICKNPNIASQRIWSNLSSKIVVVFLQKRERFLSLRLFWDLSLRHGTYFSAFKCVAVCGIAPHFVPVDEKATKKSSQYALGFKAIRVYILRQRPNSTDDFLFF
jgi:hypothetical protein